MRPDIDALEAAWAKFHGFAHRCAPNGGPLGLDRNALAELDASGKWLHWDMNAPYSTSACEFVALASDRLPALVAYIRRLEADNERLRAYIDECVEAVGADVLPAHPDDTGLIRALNGDSDGTQQLEQG